MPNSKDVEKIELFPDAWERFERAVGTVAKSGPQHKAAKPAPSDKPDGQQAAKDSEKVPSPKV